MANKKRIATSVAAVATAAALLLGGTFAWQSISQRALNEASDVINPGGRLHNDLWYVDAKTTNNDIYVENFTDAEKDGDDIYARVRLSEYMEIVMNYGSAAEKVENVAGSKTPLDDTTHSADEATEQDAYTYEYDIHYFGEPNATDEYWTWDTDGSDAGDVYYMPTFNLNKDSLAPDLNGLYADRVGGISNREMGQYEAYTEWTMGATTADTEIYDGDTNNVDEVGFDFDNLSTYETAGNILTVPSVEHTVDTVGATKGLVSIEEWLGWFDNGDGTYNYEKYENGDYGDYWVYDTDGWVYWSGAIGAGETTGLLLDSFTLNQVMDDTWYYAIEAEGEFVTADDLGEPATTGEGDENGGVSTFNLVNDESEGSDENSDIVDGGSSGDDDLAVEGGDAVVMPEDSENSGGTGFYKNGITDEALILLDIIGVDVFGEAEDEGVVDDETMQTIQITDADGNEVTALASWYTEYDGDYSYTLTLLDEGEVITADNWAVTWADGSALSADLTLTQNDDGTATLTMAAETTSVGTLKITAGEAVKYAPINYSGSVGVYVTYEDAAYYYAGENYSYGYTYAVMAYDEMSDESQDITQYYSEDDIVCTVYADEEKESTTDAVTVKDGKISATTPGTYYPEFAIKGAPYGRTAEITFVEYAEAPANATDDVIVTLTMEDDTEIPAEIAVGQPVDLSLKAVVTYEDGTPLHETHYTVDWQLTGGVRGDSEIYGSGETAYLWVADIERAEALTVTAAVTVNDGMAGRTTTEFTASKNIAVQYPTAAFTLTYNGEELGRDEDGNYVINVPAGGATVSFVPGKVTAPDGNEYDPYRKAAHAQETDTVRVVDNLEGSGVYNVYLKADDTQLITVDYHGLYANISAPSTSYTVVLQLETNYSVEEEDYVAEGFVTLVVNPMTELPESETYRIANGTDGEAADDFMLSGYNDSLQLQVVDKDTGVAAEDVNVVWEVDSADLNVSDTGEVTFNNYESMTAPLQEYTVTAEVNGTEKISAKVYVYNPNNHRLLGTATIDEKEYYVFNHTNAVVMYPVTDLYYVCIYEKGASVNEIYDYGEVEAINDSKVVSNVEVDGLPEMMSKCSHIGE